MKQIVVLFVLMMSIGAFALYLPAPIAIQIATYDTNPIPVTIMNVNTGYTIQGSVVNQAIFDEMAGNIDKGQTVRVEILGVRQEQIYTEAPMIFSFDFKTGITPPQYQCSDGSIVDDASKCPPSLDWVSVLAYIIAIILGSGMIGYGLKIYRKTTGEVGVLHKHRNVRGYHDTSITHKYQPHKKGEIAPRYSETKNKDDRYDYIG